MKYKTELEKCFKEECTVINMNAEYPGNPSPIKWVIITGYSREELENKYAEVLTSYRPYEIASPEAKEIIADFNRNEDKHKKRQLRSISIFDLDEEVDAWCPAVPSFEEDLFAQMEKDETESQIVATVRYALGKLTETQRRRLLLYRLGEKSIRDIARIEGLQDHSAIFEGIKVAEKKFIKIIKNTPTNGTPLSKYSEGVTSMSGDASSSTSNK